MQKKLILPIAILGVAMLSTACTPNNRSDQGMRPTTDNVNRVTYHDGATFPNRMINRDSLPNGTDYPNGRHADNNDRYRYGNAFNGARDLNPNMRPTSLNAEADRIANLAANVRGVDSATAAIVGKTAFVGLDIDERVNRNTEIGRIENEVILALSKAFPRYDIRVTSDKGFFRRIGAVNTGERSDKNADFLKQHVNQ